MFNPRCRFFSHPTNRAVGVVVQITEGTFGYSVTEIGCTSPAAPGSVGAAGPGSVRCLARRVSRRTLPTIEASGLPPQIVEG